MNKSGNFDLIFATSFNLIVLKAKLVLIGNAEKSERSIIRRCAELTKNDELFLKILNNYCMSMI